MPSLRKLMDSVHEINIKFNVFYILKKGKLEKNEQSIFPP